MWWLLALLGALTPARAAVPVDAGMKVLVRVMAYDRGLHSRSDGALRFGVLFDPGDPLSAAQAAAVREAIDTMASTTTVAGRPLAEAILLSADPADWSDLDLAAVVVCRGTDTLLLRLLETAGIHDIATLTLEEALVERGVAVGLSLQQARLQIVVNLPAAREQGMQLGTELLERVRLTP